MGSGQIDAVKKRIWRWRINFIDPIQEKAWAGESELICCHFDHCSGWNVTGINFLNAFYYSGDVSIPVAFELGKKPIHWSKDKKGRRKSEITKNEMLREMPTTCIRNGLKFHFVLFDRWFSSKEKVNFIRQKRNMLFLQWRTTDWLRHQRKKKRFTRIDEVDLSENTLIQGWLKGYNEPPSICPPSL